MDRPTFEMLRSAVGSAALAAADKLDPALAKFPAHVDRLSRLFPPTLARAALETVALRRKACAKFTHAERMFFTRESLEMASAEVVSQYRALRFAPYPTVADLGCGIGGDALSLAMRGHSVIAVDRDPLMLQLAEANLQVHGYSARFEQADLGEYAKLSADAAFADPGRRPQGRRVLSLHDCEPPLAVIRALFPVDFPLVVKAAPGIPHEELEALDADAEFISWQGELRECALNFGPFRIGTRRATILPGPYTLTGNPQLEPQTGPVQEFVLDPDSAITRSGLVGELAVQLGAVAISPRVAFLTAAHANPTPFGAWFRVDEVLPFHIKKVGEWLRAHDVGPVNLVKRGSNADTPELLRIWKLRGSQLKSVLLTRAHGSEVAIIADRLPP